MYRSVPLSAASAPAFFKISSGERALRHFAGPLVGLNLAQGIVVTVRGVTEEDDAEHRHAVFAGGQLRIGAAIVGGIPEVRFKLFDVLQLVLTHRRKNSRPA